MNKNLCVCVLVRSDSINQILTSLSYTLNKLSKCTKTLYIINTMNLEFFSNKKNFFKINKNIKYPKNLSFINPKSYKELKNFKKDKNIIAVNNIGRSFPELKINIILRILGIKQIIISNFGNIQGPGSFHSIDGRFKDLFFKKLPQKITIILSIFGICPKIDIRFVSRKDKINWGTKNFLSKVENFFPLKLKYTKKYVLINSLASDINSEINIRKEEKYIVLVDTNVNHKDSIRSQKKLSEDKVKKIYKTVSNFLEILEKKFKKKIIICIHPSSDINKMKNYTQNKYVIKKYKTREYIYKSFIVLFYESTAIIDAILLKKRIIALENKMMGEIWVKESNQYPTKVGIKKIDLNNFKLPNKIKFIKDLDKRSKNYSSFINNNLRHDKNELGMDKVIKEINQLSL